MTENIPAILQLALGDDGDLAWAQATVLDRHYRHAVVHRQARPLAYVLWRGRERLGLVIVGLPHATRCKGWWGEGEKRTQWQVVNLARIWLDPAVQTGGDLARPGAVPGFTDRRGIWRPAVASWTIHQVLARIQRDWVARWPPVFPGQPYHVRLVISYCDPAYHKGTIYQAAGARPLYTNKDGRARLSPAGKFCWYWSLPEPEWTWDELENIRPRNLRLPLEE